MHMDNRRKLNIPMCVALVVLCLVLFSLNMTSGLLARYTTRGTIKGGARAAEFNTVAVRGDNGGDIAFTQAAAKFDSENNLYQVKVTNKSETAVRYTVEMELPKGTLAYLTVSHIDTPAQGDQAAVLTALTFANENDEDREKDIAVFEGVVIGPNAAEVLDDFTFDVDLDKFYSLFTDPGLSAGPVDVDFDTFVKFVQVD